MARCLLALALLVGACTQKNPDYCDGDDDCGDGETCALDVAYMGLTHVCQPVGGGGVDAPLAVDGRTADAAPVRCSDGGSCPANAPICRAGVCGACDVAMLECPLSAPVCAASGTCGACSGPSGCSGRTGFTHCLNGACVECEQSSDCGDPARPVCEASTGACRPCGGDGECTVTGLCDSGRCVAKVDVLRVTATGTGDCSFDTPCSSIAQALGRVTESRKWISLAAGTFRESVAIANKTVILVGAGATSTIDPSGAANAPAVSVAGGNVTLRKLRLANATGDSNASGVSCSGGARLTIREARVESNDAIGVVANPCTLDVSRTVILRNDGGGVRIVGSNFSLVNDLIAVNGSGISGVGGVRIIDNPPGGAVAARIEYVTVAGNSRNGNGAGVSCEGLDADLAFSNSIVSGNAGSGQVSGRCVGTFSDFPEATTGVNGNSSADPLFTDVEALDFTVKTGSPAINGANPASTVTEDVDGKPRPAGGRNDMGAYEKP